MKQNNTNMKTISLEEYKKLKACRCDKGKHKFRENKFGVTWCTICGLLSSNVYGVVTPLEEDDKLLIKTQE